MDNEPLTLAQSETPAQRWRRIYVTVTLAVITVGEFGALVQFLHARQAYHADVAGSCYDECLGTFFTMIFSGFLLVAWPVAALVVAAIGYGVCSVVRGSMRRGSTDDRRPATHDRIRNS